MPEQHKSRTERRPVRSDDPSLSPAANKLLTQELREAIGSDEVIVPAGQPDRGREKHATNSTVAATLTANRPLIIVTFIGALVVGGIIALVTGQYWAVILAAALHAIGTLVVAAGALHLTTETEHVRPTVAARLEEEGVADPDRVLSELVEDYAGARDARGVAEVVSSGHNERTVQSADDPATAAVEQRTAMTPTSGAAAVAGERSAVEGLEWWVIGGLSVLSIVIAAIVGGDMWALPAIVLPLCAGWVVLQHWLAHGAGASATPDRAPGDAQGSARRLLPVAVFVVVGVIWFMAVVGWIGGVL